MNYQISIVGIGIIAVYSLLVLLIVAWPLSKLFGAVRWKWVVIAPPSLVLLALPWAEEYWIASHFHEACKDAGVHVVRKVKVEGYYDATGSGVDTPGAITFPQAIISYENGGFRFYERLIGYDPNASPLRVSHVEKGNDGRWQVTILSQPTARYHYKRAYQPTPYIFEEPVGWKLIKSGTLVVDSMTGEVIGRDVTYTRHPNSANWQFGRGGYSCPHPEKGPRQPPFPQAVLMPLSQR